MLLLAQNQRQQHQIDALSARNQRLDARQRRTDALQRRVRHQQRQIDWLMRHTHHH